MYVRLMACVHHVCEPPLLSQSLSECEDSNYTESAEPVSEAFKGTVWSLRFITHIKKKPLVFGAVSFLIPYVCIFTYPEHDDLLQKRQMWMETAPH